MTQMNFNPLLVMEIKRRQEEMVKEFELMRMARESRAAEMPKPQKASKFLANIGKELVSIGSGLEHRFGIQEIPDRGVSQQRSPEGCS
jgi:hypothetical protein